MPTWTILLADPDPLQRQLVDMLLAQEEFHIVTAGNGRDTLEFLKEHTPNLAIMAIELPDVGGDVICRKLKAVKRLSRVPVVLTTLPPGKGGATSDLRQLARAVGADVLLQKPLGDKGLREKVNALLRRWQGKEPSRPAPEATKNTVIIEEALKELGDDGDDDTATLDAVTEALYRENEDLRAELASLRRRLARLESGLVVNRAGVDPPATFIPGSEPSAPAPAREPDEGRGGTNQGAADQDAADQDAADRAATEQDGSAPASQGPGPAPEVAGAAGEPSVVGMEAPPSGGGDDPAGPESSGPEATPSVPAPPDALPPDASREELAHRVAELERRNRALLEALEEAKADTPPPRGLFGRRRR